MQEFPLLGAVGQGIQAHTANMHGGFAGLGQQEAGVQKVQFFHKVIPSCQRLIGCTALAPLTFVLLAVAISHWLNTGSLFSRKAIIPSRASADPRVFLTA